MVKFENYKYEELNFEKEVENLNSLIEKFEKASSAKKQIEVLYLINKENSRIDTAGSLCSIRNSLNVNDKYYDKQQNIWDEKGPLFNACFKRLNKAIIDSKFKKQLAKEFGSKFISDAEIALKTYDDKILEDIIEDNKLSSQYSKLTGSAKIKFRGKVYNLSGLGKFMSDVDRRTRKDASKAYYKFFEKHLEEFDSIYDKMVHVRDRMAKKLGFKNFIEFRYLQLGRTDYNSEDVKNYRDNIYKYVVPLTKKIFKKQAKRIGVKGPKYYDYNLEFKTGNPRPIGTTEELVQKAAVMYKEMSKETDEFFTFMRESNLLDLETRQGKRGGGYTSTIADYKAPYIFSNFNGTSGDVDVLTHEAGHAFMAYRCRDVKLIQNWWPTLEACEIHSMSMEHFAYPWMKSFFGDQTEKYIFGHICSAVTFLPYGVAIDEFQTYVYENPNITPAERRAKWREIETKYLPHLKYGSNKFLNEGGRFIRQGHVFNSPLYYIDYTIAQVCAFQFFNLMNKDRKDAWNRYLNLCDLGGSKSFLELLKDKGVKLVSPFKDGCIKKTIKPVKEFINSFDDSNM